MSKDMKITAAMVCSGLVKKSLSARELSIKKAVTELEVKGWMKKGVPLVKSHLMKEFYDA